MRSPVPKKRVEISVISDFACPWCWIGKRQLDEAIRANADQYDVSIKWLPYQLFPHQSFHTKEHDGAFGAETIEVDEAMTSAAQTVGINLSPTYSRTTNTLLCHVLMDFALDCTGDNTQLAERLFKATFSDGLQLNLETLISLAAEVALDQDEARAYLMNHTAIAKVQRAVQLTSRTTTSVPFYITAGSLGVSGVQDVESLERIFSEA